MPAATPTPDALVMAPVSPAVAKLLHKLQAEIIRQTEAPPVPEGAVVLQPMPRLTRASYYDGHGYRRANFQSNDIYGPSIDLQTPFIADPDHTWSRPGLWYGTETRIDDAGRTWQRSLPHKYVTDDFGQLVPVGGAQ